jgi:GT2 family glycosyltransferase
VVSVVIPCRDHGELLVEAVASAEAGAPGCELIVVNDGSRQPRTLEVLDTLRRAGYHVLDQAHAGLAAARNAGFACARGRYVLPLDADDRLRDGFVEPAVALLESDPGLGVVYGDRQMFGLRSGDVEVPEMDLDRLLAGNYIAACALVRKPAWESCGGYDPELAAWEDWDFWIALADRGWSFHHLPCIAFDHRIRPGSLVSQCESAEVGERLQQHIVRQHESLYRRRLPALLIQAQQGRAATQAAEQDRQRLSEAHAQAAAMRLDAAALREDIAALREDVAALRDERYRLYRELDSWRERVDFMASTRIWRMRDRLLRLRRAGAYTAPPALDRHRT